MLLQPYNTEWASHFEAIKIQLNNALKGVSFYIEHVGSTAVPGLAAKPIIDIDIIYPSASEFAKIKFALLEIGYYHNGNQGIEDREVFKRSGVIANAVLDKIMHHLYVCPIGSKALERHLLFRDCLRNNESAREQYQEIKYRLAEESGQHRKVYAELKELFVNDFIDKLIYRAKGKIS
jgi:GrpB-like predicted nucleotidyltransferase (UPF0157 family)